MRAYFAPGGDLYLDTYYSLSLVTADPPKEWKSLADGSFTRDLVGGEIFMAWMHDQRQGGVSDFYPSPDPDSGKRPRTLTSTSDRV